MKLIFFGTPEFAATILKYLLEKKVNVVAIVTRPDKPKGRSNAPVASAVKKVAEEYGIQLYQPEKCSTPEFYHILRSINADLFIVAAYAEIFKEEFLQIPPLGCINVHASILPKYRGAAPIQRAIMAGEKESGVTIMRMAKELDAGDILAIEKTPIGDEMTAGELTTVLADLGAKSLWRVLRQIEENRLTSSKQDPSEVTYARKVFSEECLINWKESAETLYNKIRGVTPKPGAWCWIFIRGDKKRLLIKKASKELARGKPGEIVSKTLFELVVACATGGLRLDKIQLEGKKEVRGEEFLRGVPIESISFELLST